MRALVKLELEVNKKIPYCRGMEFIETNIAHDDCVVVAIVNAALGIGKITTYDEVLKLSLKKGWYEFGRGFLCDHLEEAFKTFNLKARLVNGEANIKQIFRDIVDQKKVYVFLCESSHGDHRGHAMAAVKGKKGVKVWNPYYIDEGWKSLSKSIKSGEKYYAVEVTA